MPSFRDGGGKAGKAGIKVPDRWLRPVRRPTAGAAGCRRSSRANADSGAVVALEGAIGCPRCRY
nr:MAG TPA: hypothetical protein [Caudoviricetes sp.]